MNTDITANWHKESFQRFLMECLPALLGRHLPLADYRVAPVNAHSCEITVTLNSPSTDTTVVYRDIPQPTDEGVFEIEGKRWLVVPLASTEHLDEAEIRCVGEQLYDHIEARLGHAPEDLPWDEALVRSWLPLDRWITEFLQHGVSFDHYGSGTAQLLAEENWLAEHTHLRRLIVDHREDVCAIGQLGRVCPFETPEGTHIGQVLSLAMGAGIRDGKVIVTHDQPEAALGLTASMAPFLEHNDANRLLMGVNMARQWLQPKQAEPALVQTGNEPNAPGFWCGRNLLTAFVSWGDGTIEDSIVISQSCAERMNDPVAIEVGDKISNRHGSKGTIGRILSDDDMPHLADGTPVELAYSFVGCHTRGNFGQIREAIMSRIARAEGSPAVVPPFHAPTERELRQRLVKVGIPESGMETLTMGRDGKPLDNPSTVGWVYWGKTYHRSSEKIHAHISGPRANLQGESEYHCLRDVGAFEYIRETFNTRARRRHDSNTLAQRVAAGPVAQTDAPIPRFDELVRRLRVMGIEVQISEEQLVFAFAKPGNSSIELACPLRHPWLHDRELTHINRELLDDSDLQFAFMYDEAVEAVDFDSVAEANEKARRMLRNSVPEMLRSRAIEQLQKSVDEFAMHLLAPRHLRMVEQVFFSGRTVISPSVQLRLDQMGLPEDIAWTLFGPLVVRRLGDDKPVQARSGSATAMLETIMAESWIILHRAPTTSATSHIAFHPVLCKDEVNRLNPLVCRWLNADFDGDQAAVFLPITAAAQVEVGALLSVKGHLKRDLRLIKQLLPDQDALWGLARLALTDEGRQRISEVLGSNLPVQQGLLTRQALGAAAYALAEHEELDKVLTTLEELQRLGLHAAQESGASISPFIAGSMESPPEPDDAEPQAWRQYAEELGECIISTSDYDDPEVGPQMLAIRSGARGDVRHLVNLIGSRGVLTTVDGESRVIRHGFRDGLTPREMWVHATNARQGFAQVALDCSSAGRRLRQTLGPKGFNVLARAMRAERPGVVFARAAATGETDPLSDLDSRLFVGLPAATADC